MGRLVCFCSPGKRRTLDWPGRAPGSACKAASPALLQGDRVQCGCVGVGVMALSARVLLESSPVAA